MSASVHIRQISTFLIVCVLFLASALPTVARSEEEVEQPTEQAPEELLASPYPEEKLLGDKVIGDFVLGPGKVELELSPGQSKTVELTVSNRIGKPHMFELEVEDMTGSNDARQTVTLLGDDTGPYSLKDYVSIPQMSFMLDHNRRARIPVTISIPADAEPSGHYGSVLVKTVTVEANRGDTSSTAAPSSAVVSRIGTLFFVTVPGDVQTEGALKDFQLTSDKKIMDAGPVDFAITYENTGSIHLNPYGELRITNMFGDEVGFLVIDPWFTMPQSVRLREVSWNRDALYGRYTATVYINRGYDDIVDEMSLTFWVIPWKLLAGAAVGLFVVLMLLRLFFKRFEFKRKD